MNADKYFKRVQALRDERLALEVEADHCWKCGEETTRTDRLCETCNGAAEDLSDRLRILR